ncbi:MAG: nicotinamide mononucleotide transporter [Verrucomicrobia bacterium]|nr:nicotinamide mononucleotide transporter [Cytophagales bacterium]
MNFINIISDFIQKNISEVTGAITGLVCIYLNTKQNIWAFPLAIVSSVLYVMVFKEMGFYADAGLNAVYVVLSLYGWYQWLYGGANQTTLPVSKATSRELAILAVLGCTFTGLGYFYFKKYTDAPAPFLDSFNTAFSLVAQWLLMQKRLENWLFWILVDAIYVPMFIWREKYPTAVLYLIFLGLAVKGYLDWKKSYISFKNPSPSIKTQ